VHEDLCLSTNILFVDIILYDSSPGHNALFCANKFKMNLGDIVSEMKVSMCCGKVLRENGSGTGGWLSFSAKSCSSAAIA